VQHNKQQTHTGTTSSLPELRSYIDGGVLVPAVDRENILLNPNDLQPLQAQLSCSEQQVETALAAADAAYRDGTWENPPAAERADVIDAIADTLQEPEILENIARADAVTTGAVINVTRKMAQLAPFVFRNAAQYLRDGNLERRLPGKRGEVEYFRRPWGPALLVSPWNGPTAIGSHKIASALAAGAPCIIKPSEWAPHSALLMAEVIHRTGLPRGTFQLTCGSRQVFEDADLDQAAVGITYGLTNLNAQWCRALGRVLVHQSVKDALLKKVEQQLARIKLGHSLEESSDMGPLIHRQQHDSILAEIERLRSRGGEVIQSTPLPELPGYFVPPTLVDGCAPEDTREEIFGPVAAVHSFDSDTEALELANGTEYGLAAYVYSNNEQRAFAFSRCIRTGGVKINGYSLLSLGGPRGAWGLSGLGEEGAGESIEFFTGSRVVGLSPQDAIGGR
jgi:acyl-CoA reductase-like NAD-dependent aldehyde dehydrogenase